jgi:hypothetical protein
VFRYNIIDQQNIYGFLDILDFPERFLNSPNCHPAKSARFYQAYCTLKLEEHMKEKDCHHTLRELLNEHEY